jgi:hypothetical protein
MFLAAAYIYGALKAHVPDATGPTLGVVALCLVVPQCVSLIALIPVFMDDDATRTRYDLVIFAPLIAAVLLFIVDMLYGLYFGAGDTWLPAHLVTIGLNTDDDDDDDYSANTVYVVEASDSEQGRSADPSDGDGDRFGHVAVEKRKKARTRERTERDPLIETI